MNASVSATSCGGRVGRYGVGTCLGRVPTLINSDGAVSSRRERAQLSAPHERVLREAVQQQDQAARRRTGCQRVEGEAARNRVDDRQADPFEGAVHDVTVHE